MSNYKTVFFTLGVLQIILGISMLIPIIIQVIYNQLDSSFIGAGIIALSGIFIIVSYAPRREKCILNKISLSSM